MNRQQKKASKDAERREKVRKAKASVAGQREASGNAGQRKRGGKFIPKFVTPTAGIYERDGELLERRFFELARLSEPGCFASLGELDLAEDATAMCLMSDFLESAREGRAAKHPRIGGRFIMLTPVDPAFGVSVALDTINLHGAGVGSIHLTSSHWDDDDREIFEIPEARDLFLYTLVQLFSQFGSTACMFYFDHKTLELLAQCAAARVGVLQVIKDHKTRSFKFGIHSAIDAVFRGIMEDELFEGMGRRDVANADGTRAA